MSAVLVNRYFKCPMCTRCRSWRHLLRKGARGLRIIAGERKKSMFFADASSSLSAVSRLPQLSRSFISYCKSDLHLTVPVPADRSVHCPG